MGTTLETDMTISRLETPTDAVELSQALPRDSKLSGVFMSVERETVVEGLAY